MRPNTLHYVLTLEHSITYGRHFYATAAIQDTCRAIVHTFFLNEVITNTNHPDVRTLLHRLMAFWVKAYQVGWYGKDISQNNSATVDHKLPLQLGNRALNTSPTWILRKVCMM
jgi:hypothetical protein